MIRYSRRSLVACSTYTFRLRNFRTALLIILCVVGWAAFLHVLDVWVWDSALSTLSLDPSVYSAVTSVLSILIVFRTHHAYSRFWDGTSLAHQFMGGLFTSASSIMAFSQHSQTTKEVTERFQLRLVRLVSLLSAMVFAELEGRPDGETKLADSFDLLDIVGLERGGLRRLAREKQRAEIVFMWIKNLLVDGMHGGILTAPPPILSRVFAELDLSMTRYHDAEKLAAVPFPFPYVATADVLLVLHSFLTPIVFMGWLKFPPTAVFVFLLIFILWSLHLIAAELENPFDGEENDLDVRGMQEDLNARLVTICGTLTRRPPDLRFSTDESVRRILATKSAGDPMTMMTSFRHATCQKEVIVGSFRGRYSGRRASVSMMPNSVLEETDEDDTPVSEWIESPRMKARISTMTSRSTSEDLECKLPQSVGGSTIRSCGSPKSVGLSPSSDSGHVRSRETNNPECVASNGSQSAPASPIRGLTMPSFFGERSPRTGKDPFSREDNPSVVLGEVGGQQALQMMEDILANATYDGGDVEAHGIGERVSIYF